MVGKRGKVRPSRWEEDISDWMEDDR